MHRFRALFALVFLSALAACGGSMEPAKDAAAPPAVKPGAVRKGEAFEGHDPGISVKLASPDQKTAWLEGNIKVDVKLVKPVDTKTIYGVGAKVLAANRAGMGNFTPGTVTKVLEDGLLYEVEGEDGEPSWRGIAR